MQQIKSQQSNGGPLYDQTNRPQNSASSLLLCSCCWPSRRARDASSEASSIKQKKDKAVVVFKKEVSTSLNVINSPRHSLYLSMNDLNRPPSRNQLEVSTSRLSDVDSINDQAFITARTSRSADGRRHKSMPQLVQEIHEEFVGKQFEQVKQEFMSFFRGNAEKPQLTSTNHRVLVSTSTEPPLLPPPISSRPPSTKSSSKVRILDFSTLEEDVENPATTSRPSPPQTSTSTVYEPQSMVPVRTITAFVQRSIVRLPHRTYSILQLFEWCVYLGFQKLFAYGNNQPALPRNRYIARHS